MDTIKTVIIEDEREDADLMYNLLKEFDAIEIVATERDVESGIAALAFFKPELVFLDINLYGRLSFEILDAIKKYNMHLKIIFITAYNDYMNKAFKYAAFDYLLKPVDRNELKETLKRFIKNRNTSGFSEKYTKLQSALKNLIFGTREGFEVVNPEHILFISTVKGQNYSELHLSGGKKLTVTKSIGEIERMLSGNKTFFKIHRSYMVNLKYVKKVNRLKGICIIENSEHKTEIPVVRDNIKHLKERLKILE